MASMTKKERMAKLEQHRVNQINAEFEESRGTWATWATRILNVALNHENATVEMRVASGLMFARIKLSREGQIGGARTLDLYTTFPEYQEDGNPTSVDFRQTALSNLQELERWMNGVLAEEQERLRLESVQKGVYRKLLEHFNDEELSMIDKTLSRSSLQYLAR